MSEAAFLYSDARFRVIGAPRVAVPELARRALEEAHRALVEHPDARLARCLCGNAAEERRVSAADRHGLPFNLVLCRACGLIRVNPQPSPERLRWFYAQVYRRLYGPFAKDDAALFDSKLWKGELVQRGLSSSGLTLSKTGEPVVDLGCGGGWTLAPFAAERACIGFDFDERLIAIGRARGLDLRLGGVERALADGVRAALVILGHVLEHTLDPEAELRALAPLLAEGGLLYVEVPHTRRIGCAALRNDSACYWQRAHLWDFQRGHLAALLERAGYRVLWTSEDENSVFTLSRWAGAIQPGPWPRLGADVEAQLLGFERRHGSIAERAPRVVEAARRAAKKGSGLLRRVLT